MTDRCLSGAAEQYVERMGLLWEAEGLPRIAGRMLGYLALQAEPATLDEIAAALGVSKASVSNDARRLERLSLVERASRPGDRRDYYAIAPDMPARVVAQKVADLERLDAALSAARDLPETPDVVRTRLAAFGDFHGRVIAQLHALLSALTCDGSAPAHRTVPDES
jgi:DNA-binding transcriptional regulator GbsR (MarR family)